MIRDITVLLILLLSSNSCKKDNLTDILAPQVISTQPLNGAIDVPVSTEIVIEFDEQIIVALTSYITVNGNIAKATNLGKKIKLEASLALNVNNTVVISGNSIKDLAGNFMSEFSFFFKTEAGAPFNIDPTLVSPTPSTQATNLFNFLKTNFQQKIISGTMAAHSTNINEAAWVHDQTGKWPALTGFDFIDHTWLDQNWVEYEAPFTLGSDWWSNNGLVTLTWHWRDPLTKSGAFYTNETSFDVSKVSDPASAEYAAMIEDIDTIAGYLREFRDAKIPVLWRPLHEAAGGWFWWGAKGAAPCKALWQLMFDRLVNHHGLNNLIWVWTTNTSSDALDWYPGDNYVDIIGMDIYPGENQHGSQYIEFDKVKEIFQAKKIITLSECGSVPDPALMMEYGDTWSWFMPWNGDFTRSDAHNGATWWNKFFSYDYVITRDKMPDLK
ncbi:MAG: glycosyl hydrolase [Bacteroidales bacterium]|nr:glycosyl hydrolase [Bacteroidales bacterium]